MAGWEHFYSGKVRDLYRSDEPAIGSHGRQ